MPTSTRTKPAAPPRTRYEDDLYTWVQEQVELLRAGRLDEVDALNVAEELSDVGNSELNSLRRALAVLTQHLLKWDHQPGQRSRSWQLAVRQQRRQIRRVLNENPGLKSRLTEAVGDGYDDGRDRALDETGLADDAMPEACPYTFEETMTRPIAYEPKPFRKRGNR
jgi:hypothetical protein